MIGIKPESIKFTKEQFNSDNLIKALTEQPKKCPTIVTCNIAGAKSSDDLSPHVMVATNALKGSEFIFENGPIREALCHEWFINCKNSYRDDISEPGTVCH